MSDAAKKKGKQRWAIEKPKLDNARQLRGIFFIEPNDEEFKLTMKAARRKLEVQMPAAMPFKIPIKNSGGNPPQQWETQDKIRMCCRCRRVHDQGYKELDTNLIKITLLQNSITHQSLLHKFIPMPQA